MKITLLIHPEELTYRWIDRALACGADVLSLHPRGGVAARRTLEEMLVLLKTEHYRNMIDYAIARGLTIEYEFHAASYLLPRELFATHPEYFRENAQGERTPDLNLCPSNPDALDLVARRAVDLARALYRSTDHYYFWLDDSKDSTCHCPKCRMLSASDQAMIVYNRIEEEFKKENKNARLAYLAYYETLQPPRHVAPADGIFFEFAPIDRDFTKPLSAAPSAYFENLRALQAVFGKENGRILEYWFDNSMFSHWTKPPQRFVPHNEWIAEDILLYHQLGFEEIASFACFLGEDYEALYGEPDVSAIQKAKKCEC